MIPRNIFFYWDKDPPQELLDNIENYKNKNPEYKVTLLDDHSIDEYVDDFPTLVKLFHSATIAALKADIIRLIILYEEGGIWLDSNTTLINDDGIKILFDRYKDYDFVITLQANVRHDMTAGCLISKPKSQLAYDTLKKIEENLLRHYHLEKQTTEYIPYNFFLFVAPVVFYGLLEYKFYDEFRNNIPNLALKDDKSNILTIDLPKFREYKCGLMIVDYLLRFYGCNMNHHHRENIHKHWSNVQKTQRLFSDSAVVSDVTRDK